MLAPPKGGKEHWVEGRSALECARAWLPGTDGAELPAELEELLASHPDIRGLTVRLAMPEHHVRFDKLRGEPRNADVVAVADHPGGLIAISIEAKADEPFDEPVRAVLLTAVEKIATDQRTNLVTRVRHLASSLLPPPSPGMRHLGDLRYQLLTGVAGALAFAVEVGAKRAVFVVHEFTTRLTDDAKHRENAADLDAFVTRLSTGRVSRVPSGTLLGPFRVPGAPLFDRAPVLYVGKAVRNLRAA
jgi:hypothetical protein